MSNEDLRDLGWALAILTVLATVAALVCFLQGMTNNHFLNLNPLPNQQCLVDRTQHPKSGLVEDYKLKSIECATTAFGIPIMLPVYLGALTRICFKLAKTKKEQEQTDLIMEALGRTVFFIPLAVYTGICLVFGVGLYLGIVGLVENPAGMERILGAILFIAFIVGSMSSKSIRGIIIFWDN